MNTAFPLRIYYDASCPLCRTEMQTLKKYDVQQRLELVDCSPTDFSDADASAAGYKRSDMMRLIHARDAQGQWLIGVAVFEAAYGAAGIAGIEKMWAQPLLRPIWNRLYPWVADRRMILSKLGLTKLFGLLVDRAAARSATRRSQACTNDQCTPAGRAGE